MSDVRPEIDLLQLSRDIKHWGAELGFQDVAITDLEMGQHSAWLDEWLASSYHGEMHYMQKHRDFRASPESLVPGSLRAVCVRLDYARSRDNSFVDIEEKEQAYVSRYARGRDYHKLIRKRLQQLANRISEKVGAFGYRAFVDSAPVLERALAEKSGLGWIGKNTMLINKKAGSWFFLGELFTDLPLPVDEPADPHCGSCRACLDICPTDAFAGPNILDARKCISYLTIELRGSIPEALRPLIGNRIFGCDDCQLICPWNKFTTPSAEPDFSPRARLDSSTLIELFRWTEAEFLQKTEGSPIRRIGYECWLRNIAVALGNAPDSITVNTALESRREDDSALVREHVEWALARHQSLKKCSR